MVQHARVARPRAEGDDRTMIAGVSLDPEEIARACQRFGVTRLSIFGSALTDRFDPEESDVDFLVEYSPGAERTFPALFALRTELEHIVGRPVDLVDVRTVRNPYFARTAFGSAEEVYAA